MEEFSPVPRLSVSVQIHPRKRPSPFSTPIKSKRATLWRWSVRPMETLSPRLTSLRTYVLHFMYKEISRALIKKTLSLIIPVLPSPGQRHYWSGRTPDTEICQAHRRRRVQVHSHGFRQLGRWPGRKDYSHCPLWVSQTRRHTHHVPLQYNVKTDEEQFNSQFWGFSPLCSKVFFFFFNQQIADLKGLEQNEL